MTCLWLLSQKEGVLGSERAGCKHGYLEFEKVVVGLPQKY
jgi:hypothetical protein